MPLDEPASHRLERARRSLSGLAVGDAFGGAFFWDTEHQERVRKRDLPAATWTWSDDTAMARAVFLCLDAHQEILPDALAALLAEEYHRDPTRGYGTNAHTVLDQMWQGISWREAAGSVFEGTGSCGNGAAMRVGPVGAYFADDIWRVRDEARRSALVTHAHPEGQAGAMAVAAAAAWASQASSFDGRAMLNWAWSHTPEGATRSQLEQALALPLDREPEEAAAALGSGQKIRCQDTVPFALWCAARHLGSYPEALWATVAGGGRHGYHLCHRWQHCGALCRGGDS